MTPKTKPITATVAHPLLKIRQGIFSKLGKKANTHQLAIESKVSVQTVYKYERGDLDYLDLRVLPHLLIHGVGMTPEQALNVKLGDLFELVEENGTT